MRIATLMIGLAIASCALAPQAQAEDGPAYVVSYIEALPAAKDAAASALREFASASRKEAGSLRFEVLQRRDRPNHFAIIEAWRDRGAAEAHGQSASTRQFRDKLQPLLAAAYDERPHSAVAVGDMTAGQGATGAAVYVVTHADFIPPKKDDGTAALKQLSEPSRKEPGNLRFEVLVQNSRPNHLSVIEIWRDQPALEAHESAKHTVQFRMDTLSMSGSLYDQRLYQMTEIK
jgi:autoinducer 2-degrading protein